jgi:hypothetical protein
MNVNTESTHTHCYCTERHGTLLGFTSFGQKTFGWLTFFCYMEQCCHHLMEKPCFNCVKQQYDGQIVFVQKMLNTIMLYNTQLSDTGQNNTQYNNTEYNHTQHKVMLCHISMLLC